MGKYFLYLKLTFADDSAYQKKKGNMHKKDSISWAKIGLFYPSSLTELPAM